VNFDIRPFKEETNDEPTATNSRTTSFMDDLYARVAVEDEHQNQKWLKSKKVKLSAASRKPVLPARPDWLNPSKAEKPSSDKPESGILPSTIKKKKRFTQI
jgi:hypothetical protein